MNLLVFVQKYVYVVTELQSLREIKCSFSYSSLVIIWCWSWRPVV